MAKSYDEFLSWVLPDVPGCPEISAINAIRDATIEFCEKTLIHQVDHDPVTVIANIADYDLETPVTGTRVFKVMRAWYKGQQLHPLAPDMVRDPSIYNQLIGDYTIQKSTPKNFIQKDPSSISLLPIPDQTLASAVTMRVALAPLRSSSSCADFLYENWVEGISDGAVARLKGMAGRPFSNPEAAISHQRRFLMEVNRARLISNQGYTRGNLRVQLRRP